MVVTPLRHPVILAKLLAVIQTTKTVRNIAHLANVFPVFSDTQRKNKDFSLWLKAIEYIPVFSDTSLPIGYLSASGKFLFDRSSGHFDRTTPTPGSLGISTHEHSPKSIIPA